MFALGESTGLELPTVVAVLVDGEVLAPADGLLALVPVQPTSPLARIAIAVTAILLRCRRDVMTGRLRRHERSSQVCGVAVGSPVVVDGSLALGNPRQLITATHISRYQASPTHTTRAG